MRRRRIHAIDISDPTAPEYVGIVVPAGMNVGNYMQPLPGHLLYYWDDTVKLLDVADPASARLVGTVDLPGSPPLSAVVLKPLLVANRLFFSLPDPDSAEGHIMGVAPLEDPLEPRIEWTVRMYGLPSAVSDGLAYVNTPTESPTEDALVVVDLGCAAQ